MKFITHNKWNKWNERPYIDIKVPHRCEQAKRPTEVKLDLLAGPHWSVWELTQRWAGCDSWYAYLIMWNAGVLGCIVVNIYLCVLLVLSFDVICMLICLNDLVSRLQCIICSVFVGDCVGYSGFFCFTYAVYVERLLATELGRVAMVMQCIVGTLLAAVRALESLEVHQFHAIDQHSNVGWFQCVELIGTQGTTDKSIICWLCLDSDSSVLVFLCITLYLGFRSFFVLFCPLPSFNSSVSPFQNVIKYH